VNGHAPSADVGAAQAEENNRLAARANLLLAASIEAGALSAPVRIRNLSETGAAIEGDDLPSAGSNLVLRRLDLTVAGVVIWTSGGRCGVRFDAATEVADWLTGRRAPQAGGRDQMRVDVIQAAVRTGAPAPATPAATAAPEASGSDLDARLSQELAYVRTLLEQLGDELTDEPIVLARHTRALQSFDLAGQILGHISTILVADDRTAAVNAIGMDELRTRLLRKPPA
jgi:hypothetical protein